ncbi:MAG: iron uptake system component EfeO [Frankiaceae bacterium]|nr:iron uptake system component EfeO [Frankiaceae bacterium]
MRSIPRRSVGVVLGGVYVGLVVAASGTNGNTQAAAPTEQQATVNVALSDAGCQPTPATVPGGPVTFAITNAGSGAVTEAELQQDGKIIGEKENVTAGVDGNFALRLGAGSYSLYCPGAKQDTWTFTVSGANAAPTAAADTSLTDATSKYHDYVVAEVVALTTTTKAFTDAVRGGDMAKAKTQFAPARVHYEDIEPVAESFGDLDPNIDARIDDVPDPAQWTGFHRIEKALWVDKNLDGMVPVAQALVTDVSAVKSGIEKADLTASNLGNGANELLTEVATGKVTGEEERYSHTDLWDFAANVDGAKQAYLPLRPVLLDRNPALAQQLDTQFTAVESALASFRRGNGWELYNALTPEQTKALADRVDALAEPLSRLTAAVLPA